MINIQNRSKTMSKYSTPDVYFNEIDHTVRNNTTVGDGRGAIVFNADKGYVNQRILTTGYTDFKIQFGTPTNSSNYGHFAAEQFFANGSTQLLGVRATMGDERYAFIQYPYSGIADKNQDSATQQLQYVNYEGEHNLVLLNAFSGDLSTYSNDLWSYTTNTAKFYMYSNGNVGDFADLYSDEADKVRIVYRDSKNSNVTANTGKFYKIPTSDKLTNYNRFALNQSASDISSITNNTASAYYLHVDTSDSAAGSTTYSAIYNIDSSGNVCSGNTVLTGVTVSGNQVKVDGKVNSALSVSGDSILSATTLTYYKTYLHFDADYSLNSTDIDAAYYINSTIVNSSTTAAEKTDLLNSANILGADSAYPVDASKLIVADWDENLELKTYYVNKTAFTASSSAVSGLKYREYSHGDSDYALSIGSVSSIRCDKMTATTGSDSFAALEDLADSYGLAVTDINNSAYYNLKYTDAKTQEEVNLLVYNDGLGLAKGAYDSTADLFILYQDQNNSNKTKGEAIYYHKPEGNVILPWQISKNTDVTELIAQSTLEMFSDSTGIWNDGYTPTSVDEEPGNGDIESYSDKTKNLVIAALGPGDYLNRVGISIITPDCEDIPALNGPNTFDWKYLFDDEDKVDNGADNLTYKKVYKINVYVRNIDQDESIWGTGLTSLNYTPTESFYVSNDPSAKDLQGNSLYVTDVINGHSNYIYVSKKSVETSFLSNIDGVTTYDMPAQTYSIYSLSGGKNSKLNDIKQKTAALQLFEDSEKSDFDIIFNVEPIESFTGKQKYKAMQDKIASVAITRGKDIGFIQTTSKAAKTGALMVSESKNFKYTNGSYVAGYAGYDKAYNSEISAWINIPKSVAGACAECYCQIYSYPWMANAGTERGVIAYSQGTTPKLSKADMGKLYDQNINTSRTLPVYGECLFTQKTMLKKDSALNRIDVRVLVNTIEKNLYILLLPFIYKKNTATTRSSMKSTVEYLLGRIKAGEGVTSYSVNVKPDVNDPHLVYVNLTIIPAESIEFIEVNITLERGSGITFSEVA